MDLQQFLSRRSGSLSGAFKARHFNQNVSDEVRELAHRGLKLFPVSLAAKLNDCPDELISTATCDIATLEELSAAVLPLSGHRLAIGQSGLCIWRLDGRVGVTSFASIAPELDEYLTTLQARCGDATYALFWQPTGMKRIIAPRKLAPAVTVLGTEAGFDVPPAGAAVWVNPGAEIETLPFVLRELLASEPPDSPPGRVMPAPKPSPRPFPCRSTVRFPQPNRSLRKGHPTCNQARWNGGYRIYRQR